MASTLPIESHSVSQRISDFGRSAWSGAKSVGSSVGLMAVATAFGILRSLPSLAKQSFHALNHILFEGRPWETIKKFLSLKKGGGGGGHNPAAHGGHGGGH